MSPKQRNVMVGLVVTASLGILVWMLLTFAGAATALFVPKGLPITLTSDRADGLTEGSAVYYRGVTVGKVTSIRRSADNEHVLIRAEINAHPPLPANLTGIIKTQSALSTNNSISLELNGPSSGKLLQADVNIPVRYVGYSFIPEEFSGLVVDVRRQQLVRHLDETILAIHEQMAKAGAVLDSVQKIVGDTRMREDLRDSLNNIHQFSGELSTLSANANSTVGEVRETVSKTGRRVDDLARSLDGSIQKLGAVLDQFQNAAAKINSGQGTAGMLVNDPRLYNSLADTAKELSLAIADLKRLVEQWEQEGVSLKLRR